MAARNRAARVAVDVGYKMGDGFVPFWKHAWNSEPVAVLSVALGVLGTNLIAEPVLRSAIGASGFLMTR